MPRLIDADKYLKKVCAYKETGCGSCKLQTMCPKDAPTVEAIPVEWIEKYMAEELTTGSIMWQCLKDFVEDWEEENETR